MVLRAKPKVDAVDSKKMTALHIAAGKGNIDAVKLLVLNGSLEEMIRERLSDFMYSG